MVEFVATLKSGDARLIVRQAALDMSKTLFPAYLGQSVDGLKSPVLPDPLELPATSAYIVTLHDAYLSFLPGLCGVVATSEGRLVGETAHFVTDLASLSNHQSLMANAVDIDASLFTSVDVGWWNYYHWICFGIGKCGLVDPYLEPEYEFAFPDYRAYKQGLAAPRFHQDVWSDAIHMLKARRLFRYFGPGVYRVKKLSFLATQPSEPTTVTCIQPFFSAFSTVGNRFRESGPQRIIVLRENVPRLAAEAEMHLKRIGLSRGFEIVTLEQLPFYEQVRLFANAEQVVAPHGAGLANILFGSKDLRILELNSALDGGAELRPWFYLLAHGCGQKYCFLNGTTGDFSYKLLTEAFDMLDKI